MLGNFKTPERNEINVGSGVVFAADYAFKVGPIWIEIPFAAATNQELKSTNLNVPRDYASLFLTPGIRYRFASASRVSPFVFAGAGLAWFQQATTLQDARPNPGERNTYTPAFDFGGGVDIRIWKFINLRGEIRDFVSGNPAFGINVSGSTQHNVLLSGGLGLRF